MTTASSEIEWITLSACSNPLSTRALADLLAYSMLDSVYYEVELVILHKVEPRPMNLGFMAGSQAQCTSLARRLEELLRKGLAPHEKDSDVALKGVTTQVMPDGKCAVVARFYT